MTTCTCHLGAPLYCDVHGRVEEARLQVEAEAGRILAAGVTDEMVERATRAVQDLIDSIDRRGAMTIARRAVTAAFQDEHEPKEADRG